MNRTSIITTDGDRFHREGRGTRILLRIALIAGLIFLSAVIIGFGKAITAPTPSNRPTAQEMAILHKAEKAGGKDCRLEWNEVQGAHEAICGRGIDLDTLRHLAARPAISHGAISDPAGIALIGECLSDTTLNDTELTACLTQPSN